MLSIPSHADVFTTPCRQQQRFIDGVGAAFLDGQVKAVTGGEFPAVTEQFRPIHVGIVAPLFGHDTNHCSGQC